LERRDPTSTRQAGVPRHGVGVRLQRRLAVLDHLGAVREEACGSFVVIAVQACAPGTDDALGRGGMETAAGQQDDPEPQGRPPHRVYRASVDFELTPEQRAIQTLAREVAESEIAPHAAEWDREHGFPGSLLTRLADVGLLGVCVPEEHGGAGADFVSYILVLEELSRADAGVGVTVAVHTSACTLPILHHGTGEQRERFVPPLARGEAIGCFALTEPGAGSDAGAIVTAAGRTDGGWHIRGSKQWITNAAFGGTILFFARTDPATRTARGISAF